jgi:hypothetical protein
MATATRARRDHVVKYVAVLTSADQQRLKIYHWGLQLEGLITRKGQQKDNFRRHIMTILLMTSILVATDAETVHQTMHHLYLNRMIVYPHNAQQNYGQIISDSAN